MDNYEKTGYLNGDFRMFHLTDQKMLTYDYHYHDFNKIMIFIRGNVSYYIEGKCYSLQPYDLVLVNAGEIHKPVIHDTSTYERIIIYISPTFLNQYKADSYDLNYAFLKAKKEQGNVLRIDQIADSKMYQVLHELELALHEQEFASQLYQNLLFLEFMIHLNRASMNNHITYIETNFSNPKVATAIHYIHDHLKEDLTIDTIADMLYVNRHYLMHLFKAETGYTIGNYIASKRLLYAKELIKNGMPITEACYECGYQNYSTFFRAYKKQFQNKPKDKKEQID